MATTVSYTIQPGDSLSIIARDRLGDISRWQEIYNLNKAIIVNPNVVPVGLTIQLPAKTVSGTNTVTSAVAQTTTAVPAVKPTNFLMYAAAGVMALSVLPFLFMKKKKKSAASPQSTSATA